MRILFSCHQFFPDCYTGTERYTLDLVKQMQRMGHEVCVLTYELNELGPQHISGNGVQRHDYEFEGVSVVALRHLDVSDRGGIGAISFWPHEGELLSEIKQLIAERCFDMLHCVHPMRVGAVLDGAKQASLKVLLTLTDYWMLCPRITLLRPDGSLCEGPDHGKACASHCFKGMSGQLLYRYRECLAGLKCANVIMAPSQFLIDMFSRNGVDTSNFIHLPHGMNYAIMQNVPRRSSSIPDKTITFGFIGTVQPHKGVHVLVEAFKSVQAPNIRLKIYGGFCGEHDYFAGLKRTATGDSRIEFHGEYDYNDVAKIMEGIDVVVVPSVWYENAPLAISTAQMFGIPVITTALGGMAEMVKDGANGLTFALGDVQGLSRKIRLLADNPQMVIELGRNNLPPPRIEAEAFQLEQLYRRITLPKNWTGE
jgi:glycosyltransferase involved in cell wall biosynthesis